MPEDSDERPSDGFAAWLDALAETADEDGIFEVLASQRPPASKLARQQIRGRLKTILEEQDSRSSGPGRLSRGPRTPGFQEGGDLDGLQGQGFTIEEIEPWGSRVVGADVLDEAEGARGLRARVAEKRRRGHALGRLLHVFDCFGVSPIMDLSSPTKRCGKSTAVVLGATYAARRS